MLIEHNRFYYNTLSEYQRRIYTLFYNGLKKREKSIDINIDTFMISENGLYNIISNVYNDNPLLYYFKVTSIKVARLTNGYRVFPKYIYSNRQIAEFDRQLEIGLQKFREKYIRDGMSDYQKEIIIHDFLVKTVKYDRDWISIFTSNSNEPYNVIGALLKRRATCWGIACAFKLICDFCGLNSLVVMGDERPKLHKEGHAWNMVNICNNFYHVDVTWDINMSKYLPSHYDYFNLDDRTIRNDHAWDEDIYPRCSSKDYDYYYFNGLYVRDLNELAKYITQKLNLGEKYIAVKLGCTMPPRSLIENAIHRGIGASMAPRSYKFLISDDTNNVHIKLS